MSQDLQAVVNAGLAAAGAVDLGDGRKAFVVPGDGRIHVVDPIDEGMLEAPRRVRGTASVLEVAGFVHQWSKYSDANGSEIFADPNACKVVGVLNGDLGSSEPGFRDHRVELQCQLTPAWKAWTARDGALMEQTLFAQHIEDRAIDVVRPSSAEMLELAQSFEASTKVEFKSVSVLSSSQRALQFEETIAARAGQKGELTIPTTFDLALQPFEGSDAYKVTARFRYKIRDGHLQLGYKLERPEDVLRTAFKDVCDAVAEGTGFTPLLGIAPAAR